jgi:hypothetical protein
MGEAHRPSIQGAARTPFAFLREMGVRFGGEGRKPAEIPGFAISSGWKCHSQTTSVRSTASGQIWNASM